MGKLRILSLLSLTSGLIAQACSGSFIPLGNDDAGVGSSASVTGGASGFTTGGTTANGVTCKYSGHTYAPGASFKDADGCNDCSCMGDGQIACTLKACLSVGGAAAAGGNTGVGSTPARCTYDGHTYAVGSTVKATDGCNTCTCTTSGLACTEKWCDAAGGGGAAAAGGAGAGHACIYDGHEYPEGTSFPSTDGCNTCFCEATSVGCTKMACLSGGGGASAAGGSAPFGGGAPSAGTSSIGGSTSTGPLCTYAGVSYSEGTAFKSTDGCNTCTCLSGQVACTLMACASGGGSTGAGGSTVGGGTECSCDGLVHPAISNRCADGSYTDWYCATLSNGTCNWTMTPCPNECPAVIQSSPVCSDAKTPVPQYDDNGCLTGSVCPGTACANTPIAMPSCPQDYSPVMQYDETGCPKRYVCSSHVS